MQKKLLLLAIFSLVVCVGLKVEAAALEPFNQVQYDSIQEPVLKKMYKDLTTVTFKELPFGVSEKKIKATAGVPLNKLCIGEYTVLCYEGNELISWVAFKKNRMSAYMTISTKSFTQERVRSILGDSKLKRLVGCIPALSYSSPSVEGKNACVCWADDAMWFYVVGESKAECDNMVDMLGSKVIGGSYSS